MGRLPKGEKPEPLSVRLARYREDLEKSGGRRVIVDLDEPGASALQHIIERDGLDSRRDKIKFAITQALLHFAKRKRAG